MSLKIWLPLNGDLRNQGLIDATPTVGGTSVAVNNSGKIGKCYSFGTTSGYIDIPVTDIKKISGSCTVAFWLNIRSFNTTWATVFSANRNSASFVEEMLTFQRDNNTSAYTFHISNGTSNTTNVCKTGTLSTGAWYHFVLIADVELGQMRIYQNGELITTYSTSIVPNLSSILNFRIGVSSTGYQADILLNDFRLYDEVLPVKVIKEISKGLVLHYPLNRGGFGGDNLIKNSNALAITDTDRSASSSRTFDFNTHIGKIEVLDTTTNWWNAWRFIKTDLSEDPVDLTTGINTYTYSVDIRVTNYTTGTIQTSIDFRTSSPTVILKHILQESECDGNWHRISATATTNDQKNTQALVSFSSGSTIHGSNTVIEYKNLKLERGDKATPWIPNSADTLYSAMGLNSNVEYDVSGYGNNGIIAGTFTWANDTPKYQISSKIIPNSNIQFTPMLTGANSWTIASWIKPAIVNNGDKVWFSVEQNNYWQVTCYSNQLSIRDNSIGSTGTRKSYSFGTILANTWVHLAATYDNGVLKLYNNGVLQNTNTVGGTYLNAMNNGRWGSAVQSDYYWNGQISDARIYTTALSADDVLELYHTPVSIASNGVLMTQGELSEV